MKFNVINMLLYVPLYACCTLVVRHCWLYACCTHVVDLRLLYAGCTHIVRWLYACCTPVVHWVYTSCNTPKEVITLTQSISSPVNVCTCVFRGQFLMISNVSNSMAALRQVVCQWIFNTIDDAIVPFVLPGIVPLNLINCHNAPDCFVNMTVSARRVTCKWTQICTDHCPTTARPLPDHCPTTARPLPDHCPTTARPLPDHCPTTARPLPDHCPTTARPLPDHCPTTARPPLPDRCPTTAQVPHFLLESDDYCEL